MMLLMLGLGTGLGIGSGIRLGLLFSWCIYAYIEERSSYIILLPADDEDGDEYLDEVGTANMREEREGGKRESSERGGQEARTRFISS